MAVALNLLFMILVPLSVAFICFKNSYCSSSDSKDNCPGKHKVEPKTAWEGEMVVSSLAAVRRPSMTHGKWSN